MSAELICGLAGVLLAWLGLYGLVAARHLLRRILALNVAGTGVFMLLVSLAARPSRWTRSRTRWCSPGSS